jgi:outer membrane protein OmpA-like peptidoglycan-associated protein
MARKHNRRLRELNRAQEQRGPRYIHTEEGDEGPILSRPGFVVASAFVFVIVAVGAVWFGSAQVERTLEDRTVEALRSVGYNDIEVIADGRDVLLVGVVGDEADFETVPQQIARLDGVRNVDAELRIVEASTESGPVVGEPLTIEWGEGAAEVTGTVSSGEARTRVIQTVESLFAGAVDAGDLEIRPGVNAEDPWLDGMLDVFLQVAGGVDAGRIVVNNDEGVVNVAAEFEDRQTRTEALRSAEQQFALGGLDFVNGLTVEDAPPPAPPEVIEELQEELDELVLDQVVEFEVNSDRLTPRGTAILDEVLAALAPFPEIPVEIAGHTDSNGGDEFNLDLSERRAEAVLAYLVAAGESPGRFVVIGYGETQPIADNATADGRARNRRIEFIVLDE